jgi:hypothetical protein
MRPRCERKSPIALLASAVWLAAVVTASCTSWHTAVAPAPPATGRKATHAYGSEIWEITYRGPRPLLTAIPSAARFGKHVAFFAAPSFPQPYGPLHLTTIPLVDTAADQTALIGSLYGIYLQYQAGSVPGNCGNLTWSFTTDIPNVSPTYNPPQTSPTGVEEVLFQLPKNLTPGTIYHNAGQGTCTNPPLVSSTLHPQARPRSPGVFMAIGTPCGADLTSAVAMPASSML